MEFTEIARLIDNKELQKAQNELTKLGEKYHKNPEYLFLRGRVFFLSKLYYLSIDILFIALEFDQSDKIYNLLSDLYKVLGNEELRKKTLDKNLRFSAIKEIKDQMSGIYRKKI